jgi:hypothetical protein
VIVRPGHGDHLIRSCSLVRGEVRLFSAGRGFFFARIRASILLGGLGSVAPKGCRRERTGSNMADPKGVTERESYIIAQALYEFIRLEQSKPRDLRRWSDEQHAIAILHARFDNELATLVQSDVAAGCRPPDCVRKASIGG